MFVIEFSKEHSDTYNILVSNEYLLIKSLRSSEIKHSWKIFFTGRELQTFSLEYFLHNVNDVTEN